MADATLGVTVLRTRLDASGLKTGLARARSETDQTVRHIDQRLTSIGQGMQTLGRRMSLFITAPLTAIGAVGVKSAMQLETFAASLNVLIGDAERANRVFDELYEFSANTPFDWRTLTEGTRVLAAFGTEAEDIVPTLSMLGDIAAGTQSDLAGLAEIYGRVLVTGRMSMDEVNQLAARGVPIYTELASVLGVSTDQVRELVSAGKVGFPELQAVIRNLTSEGGKFFGMMDAQADTVAGRLARLKDSFEQVTDIVGERLLPVFDRLVNFGQRATEWFVNLDESTQRWIIGLGAGLAASGPILVGVGTLVVQIPKVVAGFTMLQTALLPLAGPAGLIAGIAVGLIALSNALSDPGGRGLSQAFADAESAVGSFEAALADAKGDMSDTRVIQTLNDSFISLGENLTGPVKRAFEGMRTELLLTVQEAENASAALTRIIIGGNLAQDLQQGGAWNARLIAGFRQAGALMFGDDRIIGADQEVQSALLRGDLEEALRIAREVERVLARAPQSGVIEGISDFVSHLEGVITRLEQPVATTVNVGVTAPTPLETGSGYDAFGLPEDGSTRTVVIDVSDPAEAARAWTARLAAELRFGLKTPASVIDLLSPRVEELRAEAAAALAEFGFDSRQFQDAVAKLDVLEAALGRIGDAAKISLSITPIASVAAAVPLSITPTASADLTGLRSIADIENDLAAARAAVRAAATAEARAEAQGVVLLLEEELRKVTRGVSLAIQPVAQVLGEARELAIEPKAGLPGARPLGITPEAVVGDFTTIELLEDQLAEARRAVRTAASDEARHEAQLVVMELERELERLKRQVTPRELGIEPRVQLARPLGIEPTAEVAPARSVVPEVTVQIDGMDPVEWQRAQERAAQEQQAAADRFASTVVSAGFAMGDAAIRAIQDGDIPGLLRAGLSGAGSILGQMDLGTLGLFGGSVGVGSLIAGGLGILGTLLGALFGGGQSDRDRAAAEQRRVGNVPAIELHFTVNQTNTYNGAPSQPENEQAFRRQANVLFEELYRRHLGPRFDRIEQRLGIAGAPA